MQSRKIEKQTKTVSSGFLCALFICVVVIAGFFYQGEQRFIENSTSITAEIIRVKAVPRRRILNLRMAVAGGDGLNASVAVPSWDTRKTGDSITVRIDHTNAALIKVDEFLYLHKTSIGILAGCSLLMVIVFGTLYSRKVPGS